MALAWTRQHDVVRAPIVGATKVQHLDDAVASLTVQLTDDERERLEILRTAAAGGVLIHQYNATTSPTSPCTDPPATGSGLDVAVALAGTPNVVNP